MERIIAAAARGPTACYRLEGGSRENRPETRTNVGRVTHENGAGVIGARLVGAYYEDRGRKHCQDQDEDKSELSSILQFI